MAAPFDGLIVANGPAESSSQLPYDVFINHHGGDVKHSVATTMYNKLDATGLRVFLDKYELKLGMFFPRALQEAMRSSSVHIAIFSENYAQSPWCLAELAFILQLPHIKFIPIFYHVEPSTLRWAIEGKGIYADAFSSYEMKNRYSSEKLESWKLALHKASLYNGKIINNQSEEEKAVMNVVNRVLEELKKVRLDVAKHAVGLDELEQDFHNKIVLQSAAGPTQIVGIWGMGGVGKTTLAKQLYNKKWSTMKRSSFLFDVREAARKDLLHEKQKELLKDLDLESKDIKNVDQGKEILRSRLRSVSVLIVLDDVDHINQLDALLPARESLGHGSLIIVTTRELHVLKAWGILAIYKIRTLNPAHAHQLFCWHAFGQRSPMLEFKELAQKFIDACCGLPLSLVVLGSLLYGESSKTYWQSQLDKLSRTMSDDIKLRLKISYDALDKEEKEIFLDIACFFIGWRSRAAIAVWDGSGWIGLHGLQSLVNKCLVEQVEKKNFVTYIRMHDNLRDLGREIANQHSPYRLWCKEQIIEIQPQQEAIQIRGMADTFGDNCYPWEGKIILNTSQGERILKPGSLGLKIFSGNSDFINEQCSELSRELVFLRCDRFEHKRFPLWLSLKKLRVLHLNEPQRLEYLWERDVDVPLQLKELHISQGHELEKIESLESLRSLEILKIRDCTKLNTLPSLAEATSLKMFDLRCCNKLEKIGSLGNLRSLETLKIYDCTELNTFPSLAEAISLKMFNLRCCNKLENIRSLESLRSLEELIIYDCTELNTLPCLAEATLLKMFDLRRCNKLENIESLESLRSLETLIIYDCTKLNTLPSLVEATSLKMFDLRRCNKLEKIESLESLRSLETFIIHDCTELNTLPSLVEATCLKKFELIRCNKLEKIGSLESLRSLETLIMHDCTELNTLPSLAEATCLKKFDLRHCNKLEKIVSLGSLRSLEELIIYDCTEFNTLPSLAETISLKMFDLRHCNKLEKIESLESLRSLETLRIHDCTELNTLPSLAEATSLKKIDLRCCNKLEKIGSLASLRSLETLRIYYCTELNTLPSLAEATSLKKIDLRRCNKLEKIESLASLRSLETLRVYYCTELNTLPSLAEATSLKEIDLRRCNKLEKIVSLESLWSLETLIIYDCTELNTLPSLAEATSLKVFALRHCNKLEKIESLQSLRSLETLIINDCTELNTLPNLAELTSLEEFKLKKCHKLEKIEGLEGLSSLKKLEVHTRLKRPCIFNLEHFESLKSLVAVANTRPVVELSISDIQNWQREVIICTRAVIDVELLKNFLTSFPLKNFVEYGSSGSLALSMPESAANAILICFFIDYVHPNILFHISTDRGNRFCTEMSNGKWLWMGIFPQGSNWLKSKRYRIQAFSEDKEVKVKEAWLLMGKEGSVLEAFHQLSQRKHELDACEKISEEQFMAVQNDVAEAFIRPDTTVVQSFVPRNKRNLEDNLEVTGCQNLSPASDPNKRRKLIKVLGEDGQEQGGA